MSHTKDKWIIVFLIYADFRKNVDEFKNGAFAMTEQMKAELNIMFKDILTVPLDSSRARMYVIMNSIDYKEVGSLKTEAKTLVYRVDNQDHLTYNQITSCRVVNKEQGDTARPSPKNPVQRSEILKQILKENISVHKNEEVFFITCDHGSAFGIFREIDPGKAKAELRKPIHHDIEHYPYLAKFWNKAIEADPEIRKLMDQDNSKKRSNIIQIGHILFRLKNTTQQNYVKDSYLITQTKLNVNRRDKTSNDQKFLLVYNEKIKELEVSIVNALTQLSPSDSVVAELTDVGVREILSNDELNSIFQEWIGADKKVAVLLMMNCWMMNLHTMYSLYETVRYLVAPQGDIGTPGYNYKDILKYLFSRKSLFKSSKELAIKCVTTIENKRMRRRSQELREDHEDVIDKWKIFAIDLQREGDDGLILMDHLSKLQKIIVRLHPQNEENKKDAGILIDIYKSMRLVSFDFTISGNPVDKACCIVDVINWLHILYSLGVNTATHQSSPIDGDTLRLITDLKDQVRGSSTTRQLVLCSSNGANVYHPLTAVVKLPPTGYGLFFPQSINTNENVIDNVKKDSLLNNFLCTWKEFIQAVYPEDVWKPFFGQ